MIYFKDYINWVEKVSSIYPSFLLLTIDLDKDNLFTFCVLLLVQMIFFCTVNTSSITIILLYYINNTVYCDSNMQLIYSIKFIYTSAVNYLHIVNLNLIDVLYIS